MIKSSEKPAGHPVASAFGKSRLLIRGNLTAQSEKSVNFSKVIWFHTGIVKCSAVLAARARIVNAGFRPPARCFSRRAAASGHWLSIKHHKRAVKASGGCQSPGNSL
jgi:hypothetical protein